MAALTPRVRLVRVDVNSGSDAFTGLGRSPPANV